jgi:hypothetical protein
MIDVRPPADDDRAWAVQVETDSWSKPVVARLGEFVDPTQLPGVIALLEGQRAGLASYASEACARGAALDERYSMPSATPP